MHILTFETTGSRASAALIDEKGSVLEEVSEGSMNHLQSLMPMTEKLLTRAGIAPSALTCVAASRGPGSFTGIRIGVATARAMAQALGVPALGVPTLMSFAYNMPDYGGLICPLLDARRSQMYGGAYLWGEESLPEEAVPEKAYDLIELLERILLQAKKRGLPEVLLMGDGAEVYRAAIEEWQGKSSIDNIRLVFAQNDKTRQNASSAARLALILYRQGKAACYEDLKPEYLRKAEAERKLEKWTIRSATTDDVPEITALDRICFSAPWSMQSFYEEIANNELAAYLVAELENRIVGYAGVWMVAGEGHITNVAVHPEQRRRGIAEALVKQLTAADGADKSVAFTLEVRPTNGAAIALYQKLGFEENGRRRGYYEDNNEDALIMWKT